MEDQKDVTSALLTKTPKSQLTAEQPSTKKMLEPTKKRYPTSKDKATVRWQEGCNCDKANPIPAEWVTHKLENNYITKFSHRSESSESHGRLPSLGVWQQKEEPPENLALKASGV